IHRSGDRTAFRSKARHHLPALGRTRAEEGSLDRHRSPFHPEGPPPFTLERLPRFHRLRPLFPGEHDPAGTGRGSDRLGIAMNAPSFRSILLFVLLLGTITGHAQKHRVFFSQNGDLPAKWIRPVDVAT